MDVPLQEGFPVPAMSRLKIRSLAANARGVLQLGHGRIEIARLLDRLTQFGIYYDVFDNASEPVPRGVEACYVPENRTLYLRDQVYQQVMRGGQRAVFTVGHELGHAVLAHRRTANRQTGATFPIYCNSEWQANVFAAEFTMPLQSILELRLTTASQISQHFGVSPAAARVRLEDLARHKELKNEKPQSVPAL
jgi:hypothetical protein